MRCPACGIDIRSRRKYRDFDVRFQYKSTWGDGFLYRATAAYDREWMSGLEFTFQDLTSLSSGKTLAGSLYDLYEPVPFTYNRASAADPWNEVRVIAIGDSVEHWMNGVRVVAYRLFSADYLDRYAVSKFGAAKTMSYNVQGDPEQGPIREGYLGFQGDHGGDLEIRNLRIDTMPGWNTAYAWPPALTGAAATRAPASPRVRMARYGGRVEVSLPGESVREASLSDLSGRPRGIAQGTTDGKVLFAAPRESGVYLFRYRDAAGLRRSIKIWISPLR